MKNQQYHYLCLIEELRKRLQNGQLHAGDVLPSEQEWAEALSIKKRDVRPILKNLEMTGVLSCSKEGEMTLSKDMRYVRQHGGTAAYDVSDTKNFTL